MSWSEVRRVGVEEVSRRHEAGEDMIIVDIRRGEAFAARHIAGARSIPAQVIEAGTHGLPRDREILLY